MIGSVPDRLYFTSSEEANALIASDPLALLVGFVLDQQVSVPKAFAGRLALRERLGAFDAATLASADLEPVFRARPAIDRFPAALGRRGPDGDRGARRRVAAHQPGRSAWLWGDEDQGAGGRAGQALWRRCGAGSGALASHARRRRLAPGAGRLPGC